MAATPAQPGDVDYDGSDLVHSSGLLVTPSIVAAGLFHFTFYFVFVLTTLSVNCILRLYVMDQCQASDGPREMLRIAVIKGRHYGHLLPMHYNDDDVCAGMRETASYCVAWWLSGRALDLRFTGCGLNPGRSAFT